MCNLNFLLQNMRWHAKGPNLLFLTRLDCQCWRRYFQSRGTAAFVVQAGQWVEGEQVALEKTGGLSPYPWSEGEPSCTVGLLQAGCSHPRTLWSCRVVPGQSEMVPQEFHLLPELGSQQCWCGSWIFFCSQISFFLHCADTVAQNFTFMNNRGATPNLTHGSTGRT